MKKIFLFAFLIFPFLLIAQDLPSLNDSELVQKSDLKKKSGWIKVRLDADFREAVSDETAKYEYYDFVNVSGYYSSTYSRALPFSFKKYRMVYTEADQHSDTKLLNGTVDLFSRSNHRIARFIFKEGFYVKMFGFEWGFPLQHYNGKLSGVWEYAPKRNSLEMWGNYFSKNGEWKWDVHELHTGQRFKDLSILPIRNSLISQKELWIGNVWQEAEFDSYKYRMYIDSTAYEGKQSATIKSIDKKIKGSGLLKQECKADPYLGKRLRMTGYVKSENVKEWAGLWLRVDDANRNVYLAHDNMRDRPITGTTPWTRYEIVFDVPPSASTISFGSILHGTGQIWVDNLKFEIVDATVKTTGWTNPEQPVTILETPENLDFEK